MLNKIFLWDTDISKLCHAIHLEPLSFSVLYTFCCRLLFRSIRIVNEVIHLKWGWGLTSDIWTVEQLPDKKQINKNSLRVNINIYIYVNVTVFALFFTLLHLIIKCRTYFILKQDDKLLQKFKNKNVKIAKVKLELFGGGKRITKLQLNCPTCFQTVVVIKCSTDPQISDNSNGMSESVLRVQPFFTNIDYG